MPGERLVGFLGDLLIHHTQESRQRFEHRHVSAQATPDGAQLQTDHAGADHAQCLGNAWQAQRAVVRQDGFFIEGRTGQRACARSGRHDHVFGRQRIRLVAGHRYLVAGVGRLLERAFAVKEGNLVFLQQVQDAIVVLLYDGGLAGVHLADVHGQVGQANAVVGKVMTRLLEIFARLEQRLRRNAADVGAGAARRRATLFIFPVVDAGCGETQLRSPNGCDVTAGAGADDDNVECFAHGYVLRYRKSGADQMSNSKRAGSSSASFIVTSPSTASRPSTMRWSYDRAR